MALKNGLPQFIVFEGDFSTANLENVDRVVCSVLKRERNFEVEHLFYVTCKVAKHGKQLFRCHSRCLIMCSSNDRSVAGTHVPTKCQLSGSYREICMRSQPPVRQSTVAKAAPLALGSWATATARTFYAHLLTTHFHSLQRPVDTCKVHRG